MNLWCVRKPANLWWFSRVFPKTRVLWLKCRVYAPVWTDSRFTSKQSYQDVRRLQDALLLFWTCLCAGTSELWDLIKVQEFLSDFYVSLCLFVLLFCLSAKQHKKKDVTSLFGPIILECWRCFPAFWCLFHINGVPSDSVRDLWCPLEGTIFPPSLFQWPTFLDLVKFDQPQFTNLVTGFHC